jgi:hypothetical protein
MALSTFIITQIYVSSDIRFLGHYKGDPILPAREIIVRPGKSTTDLAMKKGQGGWDLEILFPPLTYAVFAAFVANNPVECQFDRGLNPTKFEVAYTYGNGTRTVSNIFIVT